MHDSELRAARGVFALTCHRQRLVQVGNNVVDVLDPDAKPDHVRRDTGQAKLFPG